MTDHLESPFGASTLPRRWRTIAFKVDASIIVEVVKFTDATPDA